MAWEFTQDGWWREHRRGPGTQSIAHAHQCPLGLHRESHGDGARPTTARGEVSLGSRPLTAQHYAARPLLRRHQSAAVNPNTARATHPAPLVSQACRLVASWAAVDTMSSGPIERLVAVHAASATRTSPFRPTTAGSTSCASAPSASASAKL